MGYLNLLLYLGSVYYLTHILLFVRRESHFGPFASRRDIVQLAYRPQADQPPLLHRQPVTLFDRLRFFFGLYRIEKTENGSFIWYVNEDRLAVWTCPICLGFWISLFCSFVYVALVQDWSTWPFLVFGGAGFVALIEKVAHGSD